MKIGRIQLELIADTVSSYLSLIDQKAMREAYMELGSLSVLISVLFDQEVRIKDEFDHLSLDPFQKYEDFLEEVRTVLENIQRSLNQSKTS